jgi:2'-5' RNA ligase
MKLLNVSEIEMLNDEELLNYHGRLHSYLDRVKNSNDDFNLDDISSQHYLVYSEIKNRDLKHKVCDEMDENVTNFNKIHTLLYLEDTTIEQQIEDMMSKNAIFASEQLSKQGLTDDTINFKIIGRMRRSERFDTLEKEEPTETIEGEAAYNLYEEMSKSSKVWVLRCAIMDGDELVPINDVNLLTDVDMAVKWNTELRHPQWQGLDDKRLWEMLEDMPHRQLGEYGYWKTIARLFDKEPELGKTVSIRPARLQQFMGLGGLERYAWLQPTIMSAITEAKVDQLDSVKERGLVDVKGVVGKEANGNKDTSDNIVAGNIETDKSMDSSSSNWNAEAFIDEDNEKEDDSEPPIDKAISEVQCWVASFPIDKEKLLKAQTTYGISTNDDTGQGGLHLTLACFDSLKDVVKIRDILSSSDASRFLFTSRILDAFGKDGNVLVLRGDVDDNVIELANKLRDCDSAITNYDFSPHITLGIVDEATIYEVKVPSDIRFGSPVFMISIPDKEVEKYQHSNSKCMYPKCDEKPKYQVLWCEGRANCWFCEKHLINWLNGDLNGKYGSMFDSVNEVKEVTTDEVPKWKENSNPNIWEALKEQLLKRYEGL